MKNKLITGLLIALTSTSVFAERLATVETSGVFFKDKLHVEVFDDPTLKGVSCYINLPSRSLSFEDQSNTSISCRQVSDKIEGDLVSKKNLFGRSKGLFFKHVTVDRVYDKKRNVLVYFSYVKKLTGDNASSSISVVPVQ